MDTLVIPVPPLLFAVGLPVTLFLLLLLFRTRLVELWHGIVGLVQFGQELSKLGTTNQRVGDNEAAIRRIGREVTDMHDRLESQGDEAEGFRDQVLVKLDDLHRYMRTRDAAYGIQLDTLHRKVDRLERYLNGALPQGDPE